MIVSTGSIPFDLHVAISFVLIGLEELAMSAVPSIRAAMPTPEPPPRTLMFTFGRDSMNVSAAIWAMGSTVVDPVVVRLFGLFLAAKLWTVTKDRAIIKNPNVLSFDISLLLFARKHLLPQISQIKTYILSHKATATTNYSNYTNFFFSFSTTESRNSERHRESYISQR
jgi:hypothetical protein